MTHAELLSLFPGAHKSGSGHKARCPAHDDRQASLSIAQGDNDGRTLLHCHAGCTTDAICSAIGLTIGDLFAEGTPQPQQSTKPKQSFPTLDAAIADYDRWIGGQRAGQWTYHDDRGNVAIVVTRWDTPNGKKIRPASLHAGGWIQADPPKPWPIYNLAEVKAAEVVYVVEGEKCAEAVRSIGLVGTTTAHGAQSPQNSDLSPLAGKLVVIVPDADKAGRKYANAVAKILSELSPPATVRIVELPGLADGEDICDWIEQREAAEPEELRKQIEALVEQAKPSERLTLNDAPNLICFSDIEAKAVDWLWPNRIPLARISVVAGRQGEGKGMITADMAARVTTGRDWPDGSPCPLGSVIWMSGEDDPNDTLRPRLDAHGADVSKVHLLSTFKRFSHDGKESELAVTLQDVATIEAALQQLPDCKLVIVDPIGSFVGGRIDSWKDDQVRSVLTPIGRLAEKYGPTFLLVAHHRKGHATSADDLVLGSRAFTAFARATWHVFRDIANSGRRFFLGGKCNLAKEVDGLAFTIVDPGRVQWEDTPIKMRADDALHLQMPDVKPGPRPKAREQAAAWLRQALAGGPVEANAIRVEAEAAGLAWRTVEKAKQELSVESFQERFGEPWKWGFPAIWLSERTEVSQGTERTDESAQTASAPSPLSDKGSQKLADWPALSA